MVAAKVPESVLAKLDVFANANGLNRTDAIILAIKNSLGGRNGK